MTKAQFQTTLETKGADYSYPLLQKTHITTSTEVMAFFPIPPFLVYDGFERDLDAAVVYERLICHVPVTYRL